MLKFGTKGFFISFFIMAVIVVFGLWINFERAACIKNMKIEFQRFQDSIIDAGLDISYSDLQFSKSSIFGVMVIKDLRINNLKANNYIEYYAHQVKLNPSLFNIGKIKITFDGEQKLKQGEDSYNVFLSEFSILLGFCKYDGLKSISVIGKEIEIEDIIKIGSLKLASQKMSPQQINYLAPFFENHLELNDIEVTTTEPWPISKEVKRVYLNANIVGALKSHASYKDSIMQWLSSGGMIDIKKLNINWDNFVMVGKGDIYFNESMEPSLHLNTSSKGMLAFIDNLQGSDFLDSKGVFVAKILLGNKAFKLKEDDKYFTITTPINVNKNELTVENIAIKKF